MEISRGSCGLSDPNDINSPLKTCVFASVLLGTTSSPFLLRATINNNLNTNYKENEIAETLEKIFVCR